jgi:hypothetical protein
VVSSVPPNKCWDGKCPFEAMTAFFPILFSSDIHPSIECFVVLDVSVKCCCQHTPQHSVKTQKTAIYAVSTFKT